MNRFKKADRRFIENTIIVTIAVCFIIAFIFMLINIVPVSKSISHAVATVYKPVKPIVIAIILTFFLLRPTDFLEEKLSGRLHVRKGITRAVSAVITVIVAILLILLVFYIVIPSTVRGISALITSLQENMPAIEKFILEFRNNWIVTKICDAVGIDVTSSAGVENGLEKIIQNSRELVNVYGENVLKATMSIYNAVYNIFVAIFMTIYLLIDTKQLTRQVSTFAEAVLPESIYYKAGYVLELTNHMFFKFLSGKAICSVIVGLICFILCLIFRIQYAILITFIIAITNMIPLFGPIFGAIPCTVFALVSGGPVKGLIMLAIILAVQQIDQNILAPNIIGDVVGLDGFWIIVAITFCGSLWGVVGMIIGIPLFGVLKIVISQWLEGKRLKKENIELNRNLD